MYCFRPTKWLFIIIDYLHIFFFLDMEDSGKCIRKYVLFVTIYQYLTFYTPLNYTWGQLTFTCYLSFRKRTRRCPKRFGQFIFQPVYFLDIDFFHVNFTEHVFISCCYFWQMHVRSFVDSNLFSKWITSNVTDISRQSYCKFREWCLIITTINWRIPWYSRSVEL